MVILCSRESDGYNGSIDCVTIIFEQPCQLYSQYVYVLYHYIQFSPLDHLLPCDLGMSTTPDIGRTPRRRQGRRRPHSTIFHCAFFSTVQDQLHTTNSTCTNNSAHGVSGTDSLFRAVTSYFSLSTQHYFTGSTHCLPCHYWIDLPSVYHHIGGYQPGCRCRWAILHVPGQTVGICSGIVMDNHYAFLSPFPGFPLTFSTPSIRQSLLRCRNG